MTDPNSVMTSVSIVLLKLKSKLKYKLMILTAALFVRVKNYRQPKWFSIEKWLSKIWYINTIKYYVVLKENGGRST